MTVTLFDQTIKVVLDKVPLCIATSCDHELELLEAIDATLKEGMRVAAGGGISDFLSNAIEITSSTSAKIQKELTAALGLVFVGFTLSN